MMKRGRSFWVLWAFAATGMSMSGCAMSQGKRNGTVLGAMVGAIVGGGVGAGVGPEFRHKGSDEDDERAAGVAIGVGAGALIGGLIGYALASDEAEPPPPPPPPSPPPAPMVEAPPAPAVIRLRGVNFDYNKSNIKSEFVPVLEEAAQTLKDNPDVNVKISGHTDSHGSDDYNQRLSERRAQAVKQYLVSKGIASSRLSTEGRGEREPIAENMKGGRDNPEGRAMNRRVELAIVR